MSVAGKQQLLRNLNGRLASELTITQMNAVMLALTEEMESFEVEAVPGTGVGGCSMDMLEEYLNAKTIEGKSPATLARYRYFLVRMLTAIDAPISRITVFHLRQYMMSERNRGISDSTLNGFRSIMCSFFNWLQREALIQQNPVANLGPVRSARVVRLPYSDVEVEQLKAACKTIRDKAMVTFMLSTGCRVSEVVGAKRAALNFDTMSCKILGKGNKERIVYIDAVTAMYLRQYLAARTDECPQLFVSHHGEPITPCCVQVMLRRLGEATGIPNVHPHRFRRTLATNLINRGMAIQEVAHILGHEKIDTTMRYVYIENENVRAAYQRYR